MGTELVSECACLDLRIELPHWQTIRGVLLLLQRCWTVEVDVKRRADREMSGPVWKVRLCQLFGFCHQYKGHDKMLLRKMELFCILYAVPEGSTSRKVFLASWVYGIGQPVPMDIVLPRCGEIYTKLLCSKSFLQVERHHLEANRWNVSENCICARYALAFEIPNEIDGTEHCSASRERSYKLQGSVQKVKTSKLRSSQCMEYVSVLVKWQF